MKGYIKYPLYFVGIMIIGIACFCAYYIYAPFYFPKPTGNYAVGTLQYHWIDTSRLETRAHDPAHPHRELMVKAWYPTEMPATGPYVTPYAPELINFYKQQDRTIKDRIVALICGANRPLYAYYKPQVPIAQADLPFPIIIFSHGFGVPVDHYTAYCTELASHGYVIFSINHTHDCTFVDFSDGRRVMMAHEVDTMSEIEFEVFFEKNIETWIADVRFVLNQIENEAQSSSSQFYLKLDLKHSGIFGHSFGGSTAIQCCRQDNRFTAGASLDSALCGTDFAKHFAKPFMFIRAMAEHKTIKKEMKKTLKSEKLAVAKKFFKERVTKGIKELAKKLAPDGYIIDLNNAYHMTLYDAAIFKHTSPFTFIVNYLGAGSANGFEITRTINSYLVAFFDMYLKGKQSGVLVPFRMHKSKE